MPNRKPIRPEHQALLTEWLRSGQARRWRVQVGLSQEQAAIQIGISVWTYANWEKGQSRPRAPRNQVAYRVINQWRQKIERAAEHGS